MIDKNFYDQKSTAWWRKKLTPEQYQVLRQKGTEAPFTGDLLTQKGTGMYACAACEQPLFSSGTKFESGSGWPSFFEVATKGAVLLEEDDSLGIKRIEVTCANCGSHLGHVFDDGPAPTGKRYCINSVCLKFKPKATKDKII